MWIMKVGPISPTYKSYTFLYATYWLAKEKKTNAAREKQMVQENIV